MNVLSDWSRKPLVTASTTNPSPPGSRNSWWYAECPKHGRTAHLSYLGGNCEECQKEHLEAQDGTHER